MKWLYQKSKSGISDEDGNDDTIAVDFGEDRWIVDLDLKNIITKISEKRTWNSDEEKSKKPDESYHINFAVLQRIYIKQLKSQVARQAVKLRFEPEEPKGWQSTLQEYIQALQNYEYMEKRSTQSDDPFYMSGENYLERHALKEIIGRYKKRFEGKPVFNTTGNWQKRPEDSCLVRDTRKDNYLRNWNKGFYQRLGVAAVGGIFLMVPMWLMVLHNTLWTGLVSTTLFVTVFGLMAAAFLESSMDVMSSTAAYAAVLVVFVGLNI
ncbi:hypothetical protein FPOAC2_12683 [Fusarium poae]|uniref:hypothetical protein n=1 Tax=Fusarium poae TaxID=36050 RepID=UPI001CE748E3|nr:hypothetical protein FPOAC1_012350 [Fusarium poae]KAG8667517.1 hypothetical protein FPOAC1_012350 [Fusarium poae]